MPYFIKRLTQVNTWTDKHGEERTNTRTLDFTTEELIAIAADEPTRIFEVTQSHADQVLLRGTNYQEVPADAIKRGVELAATSVSVPASTEVESTGQEEGTVIGFGSASAEGVAGPDDSGVPKEIAAVSSDKQPAKGRQRRVRKNGPRVSTLKHPAEKS